MTDLDQIHSLLRKLTIEENVLKAGLLARELSWMLQSPTVEATETETGIVDLTQAQPSP